MRVRLYICLGSLALMQVLLLFMRSISRATSETGPASAGTNKLVRQPKDGSWWCPDCSGELCDRKFLFIVATGRSGSSTLLNMVNQVPGFFLWGENHGALGGLALMQQRFLEAANQTCPGSAPLETPLRCSKLLRNARDVVWEWLAPPSFQSDWKRVEVRGFKELRWNSTIFQFIRRSCPCSRLIFSFRLDLEAQTHSAFFKRSKKTKEDLLARMEATSALVAQSGLPVYSLALENFTAAEFTRLARWLGAPCTFDTVYNTNSGGHIDAATTQARCL
ncbi:unnamed protein product [Symbiodinium natans]|uniref:Protein-tyrosine sulfotransferase n=1 Tax=Symbiodinium natans TaxID=878477 RepID=A0A812SEL9_9DINO|nr:unnamed protein product [Symbiodinium natans]